MKRFYVVTRGWSSDRHYFRTTGKTSMRREEGVGDLEPHVWGVADEPGASGSGWFPVRKIRYVAAASRSR